MKVITLKCQSLSGKPLEASYLPERGMNMVSLKYGDIEVIDQTTKDEFEKKYSGLGALIGPHFHRRPPHLIPKINEAEFPHTEYLKNNPAADPFTHGIGRYAPWNVTHTDHSFHAHLSGKDQWNGISLAELEGQNFEMTFIGKLTPSGLQIHLSVVSDRDSIVGIHYYYGLSGGQGMVISQVKDTYISNNKMEKIPDHWSLDAQNTLTYPLDQDTDFTFFPYPDPLAGRVILDTKTHQVVTTYRCNCAENSWQLWHPKESSFVCIEPVSSQNPRRPNLSVSSIGIQLQLFDKESSH